MMVTDENDDDEPTTVTTAPRRSPADVLFGNAGTAPAAASPATTPARPTERTKSHADVLFPDSPVPPAADSVLPLGRAPSALDSWTINQDEVDLFGRDYHAPSEVFPITTALRPVLRERESEVMTVLGLGEAERIARHREFAAAIRDSGVDPDTVGQQLYNVWTNAQLASKRGREVDDNKARAEFREDISREVLARYGPARGERIVKAVDPYLAENPGLKNVVETDGVVGQFGFKTAFWGILDRIIEEGDL